MTRSSKFTILDLPPTNWCYWCSNNSCVWIQIQTFLQRDCLGMRGSITLIPANRWSKCTRCVCSYKDCARAHTHAPPFSKKEKEEKEVNIKFNNVPKRHLHDNQVWDPRGPPTQPANRVWRQPHYTFPGSQQYLPAELCTAALPGASSSSSSFSCTPPPSLFHEHFSQERRVLFHIPKFSRTLMEAN